MSIIIEHLQFSYGRIAAVDDVSVRAAPGRITAVLGPNAAGKSTLLRCIIGSLAPAGGSVLIDDRTAHRMSAGELARSIAYVPQRSTVAAAFTVRQVVELGRYALPIRPDRIDQSLAELELADLADRPYPDLSVGQQQRVTLARALAQLEPSGHLILDEPTAAMDLRHLQQCLRLLRQRADAGATVVVAMHDLSLAALLADEVWLLNGGRLAAAGTTRQVLTVERLRSVFGVRFEWIDGPDGRPFLWSPLRLDELMNSN